MGYAMICKCRLCKKVFATNNIYSKKIAEDVLKRLKTSNITTEIHYCKNGSLGMSDILGFKELN